MIIEAIDSELSDEEFVRQFEDCSLNPKYFNHIGHLRIAWIYLERLELERANRKVCSGIKKYAESLGAKDKFNLTITDALVKIMATRKRPFQGWNEFLSDNNDLVNNAIGILLEYFSEDLLFSESSRTSVVKGDIKLLNSN